jgi:sugar phosphate isomerase/epimerase
MTTTPPIALQLYTLRHLTHVDFESTLRRVAEIGFRGVEFAELHDVAPARLKELADEVGLTVVAAHAQEDTGAGRFDEVATLGTRTLIENGNEDDFASADTVGRLADRLNAALPDALERGMTLGYHNHSAEFSNRIDGRAGYEVLMERLDPRIIAEVDAFWVTVGGVDAAAVITALGDRVRFIHVKDGVELEPDGNQTAVGAGALDIPAITTANPLVEWHIVELDRCRTDMLEAVEQSYRYLVGRGLSSGRVAV